MSGTAAPSPTTGPVAAATKSPEIAGTILNRYAMNVQLGLGHEGKHEELPGVVSMSPSETNQRVFYARWAEMDASAELEPDQPRARNEGLNL